MNSVGDAFLGGFLLVLMAIMCAKGDSIQRALEERRLRRHHCPTPCRESMRCRCGCGGLHSVGERQESCGLCGTPIVYDEESEITQETYWRYP